MLWLSWDLMVYIKNIVHMSIYSPGIQACYSRACVRVCLWKVLIHPRNLEVQQINLMQQNLLFLFFF